MGNFKEDIAKVEAFVFDVDGVFTDGGIIPLADGDFIRKYYAKDGYAVLSVAAGAKSCANDSNTLASRNYTSMCPTSWDV